MGRAIDRAGIQFRMLNRSKGPAVRGPRAQADRKLYRQAMQALLAEQAESRDPRRRGRGSADRCGRPALPGVRLAGGGAIACGAAVLTTGTFLRGLIHIGEETIPAGPGGRGAVPGPGADPAATGPAPGPAEDRHAAAARRPDHRLGGAGCPAGRRPAGAHVLSDRRGSRCRRFPAISPKRRWRAMSSSAAICTARPCLFGPDRRHRPALLPLDRGQGGAICRQGPAPDLPGAGRAGRPDHLSQRHLHLAAPGCAARSPEDHPGAGKGRDDPAGLCHRVRFRRSTGADARRSSCAACPACSWPARSMARRAMRRPRPRG